MIQLIEAPPRSGKSYFAVNYLCKFTTYDALYREYVLDPAVLIISNIEGLKINHWKLDECLKTRTLKEFFSIDNFEKIMEKTRKTHVILAIDECHDYFPAGFVDHDIYSFFAFHGHIGLDVILMTQSLDRTSRMFNPLLEFVVKVTPRSRSLLNNFSYSYVDIKGRFLYSKSLAKKPLVFAAYKSFRKDEQNKPKNAVKHWIVVTIVFLVVAGFCFKSALAVIRGKSDAGKRPAEIAQKRLAPVSSVPSAVPAPASASFAPVSSARNFVASAASQPSRSPSPVVAWRSYPVEGYILSGSKRYYLIYGRYVESWRCRHYDSGLQSIDYYGKELVPDQRAEARRSGTSSPVALAAELPPKAEPLGVAGNNPSVVSTHPEYLPIPSATDIKKEYVKKMM